MRLDSLRSLYRRELQDLHDAEDQLADMLPRMADAAADESLKDQFRRHGKQAGEHRSRLEKILAEEEDETDSVESAGMRGILSEAKNFIDGDDIDPSVRDAALLAIAQKTEHYEMASYGALRTYAKLLGEDDAHKLLHQTLQEEGEADDRLTDIARKSVNPAVA